MRDTLSVTEEALIFCIVPLGIGSESKVSRSVTQWIRSELGSVQWPKKLFQCLAISER